NDDRALLVYAPVAPADGDIGQAFGEVVSVVVLRLDDERARAINEAVSVVDDNERQSLRKTRHLLETWLHNPLPALVYKTVLPPDERHRQALAKTAHRIELRFDRKLARMINEAIAQRPRHGLHRRESFRVGAGEIQIRQFKDPFAFAINHTAPRARFGVSQSVREIPSHVELRFDDDLARAIYVTPQIILPDEIERVRVLLIRVLFVRLRRACAD